MVQLRNLLAATLSGATASTNDFRGRLEIKYENMNQEVNVGNMETLKVCVLNFNYNPDSRRCEDAPEGRLESKSEIGMFGTGEVALFGHGSTQADFPFTAVWPGDLSVITWTGDDASRVHTFAGELKARASREWKRFNVEGVHLQARVTCLAPFYGEDCDTICDAPSERRKKILGHYTCNENGEKVCDKHFTTELGDDLPCLKRICPANCAECPNGRCRKCESGYILGEGRECKLPPTSPPVNTSPCKSRPCGDNGNCIARGNSFQCICEAGYLGVPCLPIAAPITEPCSATCANNGVCYDGNKCACPEGFAGEFCEVQEKDNLLLGIVAGIMVSVLGALLVVTGFIARRRSQLRKESTAVVSDEERIIEEATHSRAEGAFLLSESTLQAAYSKPCSPVKAAKNHQEDSFATNSSDMSLSAPPSYNEALQS